MAGPIRISILADSRPAVQGMRNVEGAATGMGSKLGGIGKGIAAGFAGLGTLFAVGKVAEGFKEVIGQAADLQAAVGSTKQVFGDAAGGMLNWSKSAATNLGLSQAEALDATKVFGGFFTAVGMNTKQAAGMSQSWATMASNLAAFGDMPTADAIDAVTGALRGELDPLQRYIPTISAASIQQKAMALTGKKNAAALTQQDKAAAINAIMMDSVANKAGAAERAQGGYAVQMGKLKAQVKDAAAQLGSVFLPVLTGGMKFVNDTAIPALKNFAAMAGPKLKSALGAIGGFKPPKAVVDIAQSKEVSSIIANIRSGFASLGPAVSKFFAVVAPIFRAVAQALGAAFNKAVPQIKAIFGTIGGIVADMFASVKAVIMTVVNVIQVVWKNFGANILGYLSATFSSIVTILQGFFAIIKGVWDVITGLLTGNWSKAWDGVKGIVGGVWTVIQGVLNQIRAGIALFVGVVGKVLGAGWGLVKTAAAAVWRGILGVIVGAWNGIKAGVGAAVRFVAGLVTGAWNAIRAATSAVWNGIRGFLSSFWAGVKALVGSAVGTVRALISAAWNAVRSATVSAWNGIKAAVSSGISGVIGFITGLPGKIRGALSGAAGWLVGVGEDILRGLMQGIDNMVNVVLGKIRSVGSSIIGAAKGILKIGSPSKVFAEIGKFIGQGLIVGLTGTIPQIASTMKKLTDLVTKAFTGSKRASWLARIKADNTTLQKLAAERDANVKKLAANQAQLSDLLKAKADVIASVRDTFAQSFQLVDQAAQDGDTSISGILERSGQAVQQAAAFAQQLAALKEKGLSPAVLQELAAAGPQAGAATARALMDASQSELTQLNDNYQQIAQSGTVAGQAIGAAMYDAGIQSVQALIKGLQSRQAEIDAEMKRIAARLQAGLRAAVGIKVTAPATPKAKGKATAASAGITAAGAGPISITVNTGVIVDKRGMVDAITDAINEVAAQIGRPIKMAVTP